MNYYIISVFIRIIYTDKEALRLTSVQPTCQAYKLNSFSPPASYIQITVNFKSNVLFFQRSYQPVIRQKVLCSPAHLNAKTQCSSSTMKSMQMFYNVLQLLRLNTVPGLHKRTDADHLVVRGGNVQGKCSSIPDETYLPSETSCNES